MSYLTLLEASGGWIMYCGKCDSYIKQSDPQNFSGRKTIVIDDDQDDCPTCKQEIAGAQALMGRLGTPEQKLLTGVSNAN